MKKNKFLGPSMAMILAMVLSSFTVLKNHSPLKTTDDVWYIYNGANNLVARANPNNYSLMDPQPSSIKMECPGNDQLCAVRLPEFTLHPLFVPSISIEMAICFQTETEEIELKAFDK